MVDAGKTMRPACLKSFPKLGVSTIDALIITHDHADAMFGLDDLRDLQQSTEVLDDEGKLLGYRVAGTGKMRIISNEKTLRIARTSFPYLAKPADFVAPGLLRRRVAAFSWEQIPHDNALLDFEGLPVRCFPVYHGGEYISLGFTFGVREDGVRPFVYISDVKAFPPDTLSMLEAAPIDILVLDMLRRTDHTTHFSFDEAVACAKQLKARKTYFVGMASCEVGDHDEVNAELKELAPDLEMELAYDGLCLPAMETGAADPAEWQACMPCAPEGY